VSWVEPDDGAARAPRTLRGVDEQVRRRALVWPIRTDTLLVDQIPRSGGSSESRLISWKL
jgi:hypothetical protein